MSRSLGLPVKHLHETARQVVRVELKSGVLYRGIMIECEDNWNCQLGNIICTAKANKYGGILTTISAHKMMIGLGFTTARVVRGLLHPQMFSPGGNSGSLGEVPSTLSMSKRTSILQML